MDVFNVFLYLIYEYIIWGFIYKLFSYLKCIILIITNLLSSQVPGCIINYDRRTLNLHNQPKNSGVNYNNENDIVNNLIVRKKKVFKCGSYYNCF